MTHPVVARRLAEQRQMLDAVRDWAAGLDDELGVEAVVVFGSVARGDFNKWSDIDVLVVADNLPAGGRDRLGLLRTGAPLGVQPVGWTPAELARRRARRDPIAVEAAAVGVTVRGAFP